MPQALLSINSISKSFYNQRALEDVSFDVYEGEVVGLLGANGAGKSTLLKIIGGTLKPDSGSILISGNQIENNSPRKALQLGIVSVYQELNLFSYLTVAENLFIGQEIKSQVGTIDWKETNRQAKNILDSYDLGIKPDALVSNLSIAKQHMVEIARAFNENPKILLLDEPTSALSESEIDWLFAKIRETAKNGTTVIYVSHRLDEVAEICDRTIILRDGNLVHISSGSMEKASVIYHIVGYDVVLEKAFTEENTQEIVFEAQGLESQNGIRASNFFVRKGEILGIAGLVGSGRTELLHSIFGIDKLTSGTIIKDNKTIQIHNPTDAIKNGIILVPEDRKVSGLFLSESARFNIAASTLDDRVNLGLVENKTEKEATKKSAEKVLLDTNRLEDFVRQLSGGNQQKTVIAKTLLANSDVLLLDEPTRGVDIGAREEIYEIIKSLVQNGKSIILVTSDWEELIHLSHRVMVMSENRLVGEIEGDITESAIMHRIVSTSVKTKKKKVKSENLFNRLFLDTNNNFLLLFIILLTGLLLGSIINPFFRTWLNFSNLFGQSMILIILSLGQLIVIIAGGIDISSGALMAATSVIGLTIMTEYNQPPIIGILAMVAFGMLIGTVNPLLVLKARVDPFVVTIGMMLILEGVALVVSPKPFGPSPEIFKVLFSSDLFGIPSAMILLVILLLLFGLLLRFSTLGRRFYAVGENRINSYNAGINVNLVIFLSYMFCSLMSVLAATYTLGRFGAADPVLGPGMELEAIATVLIGGATLAGGRGSILGTVIGVFVLGILANLLSLMDINVWYQEVIRGVLLLLIIASYERMIRSKEAVHT